VELGPTTQPQQPIVGWEVPDQGGRGGRRPLGELLGEVFSVYRRRARPILWLAILIEGLATLVTLPYLAVVVSHMADYLRLMWDTFVTSDNWRSIVVIPALPPVATDPVLAAIGGFVGVVPLGSTLLLMGAVSALQLASPEQPLTASGALRAVLRRPRPCVPSSRRGLSREVR
jgi:hypothetical protein